MLLLLLILLSLIWGAVLFFLGYAASFFLKTKWLRYVSGLVVVLLLFTVPIRDELSGAKEFEDLCAHGGIYSIPKDAEGKKFDLMYRSTPYENISGYSRPVRVKTISFVDAASGQAMAVAKAYSAGGGWLVQKKIFVLTSTDGPLIGRSECLPAESEEIRRQKITNKLVN